MEETSNNFAEEIKDNIVFDDIETNKFSKTEQNDQGQVDVNSANSEADCLTELEKHRNNTDGKINNVSSKSGDSSHRDMGKMQQACLTKYPPIRPRPLTESFNDTFSSDKKKAVSSGTSSLTCSTCGLKCRSNGQLKTHLLIHSGLKPYICKTCNKSFTREWDLRRHHGVHKRAKSKQRVKKEIKSLQAGDNIRKISRVAIMTTASTRILQEKSDVVEDDII